MLIHQLADLLLVPHQRNLLRLRLQLQQFFVNLVPERSFYAPEVEILPKKVVSSFMVS